jgi:hypothetical protein
MRARIEWSIESSSSYIPELWKLFGKIKKSGCEALGTPYANGLPAADSVGSRNADLTVSGSFVRLGW